MRRRLGLVALGALLCLSFLIALWPARIAVGWLVPAGATLGGVTGTVWNGSASRVRIGVMEVGTLRWDAQPSRFLLLRPTWHLEASRPDGFARGTVGLRGATEVRVDGLELGTTLDALSSWMNTMGTQGNISARIDEIGLESGRLTALAGRVLIDSVQPIGLRDIDLGSLQIDIPGDQTGPFTGTVVAVSGPLRIEQGRVQIQTDGGFVLDGLVAPQPDAPEQIVQGLQFLGEADAEGFRRFSYQASL